MVTLASSAQSSREAADAGIGNVVSVKGLTKIFKDFWGRPKAKAVNDVYFEVRRGEVFGLLGPNGSGKSTTIKLLLGLLYPTKGHIQVFGHSPRHVATKSRIGYLPEESYLYKYLDSAETLNFFGNLFNLNKLERKQRIEQLIEMVGLKNAASRQVGEFSKGMQRRIGLAQALINDPDLVILDEPTSGMDPIGCREIKDLIKALAKRGKTVILSSHLLSDVEDVCDRVVIYYGGRVQALGALQELLTTPEVTRIITPTLPRKTMEQILKIIRQDVDKAKISIDNPTQNLESYFLGVVEKARQDEASTSGVVSGNRMADYLKADAETTDSADQFLERWTKPSAAASKSAPSKPKPPKIDEAMLKKLSQLEEEKMQPKIETAPKPADSLEKADEKLSSLLDASGAETKEKQQSSG